MKALKAYFLSLQLREKLLLAAFLVMGALIWLTVFSGKAGAFWRKESGRLATIKRQETVLQSREAVEQRAVAASATLKPGSSLNANELSAQVNQILMAAGIRNASSSIVQAKDAPNSKLALHSVRASASNVSWDSLKNFYESVERRRPYISIDELTVNLTSPQTALHSINVKISSIQVMQ
jgi:hypothetical protein